MNDKITISTFELFKMFPDQESARSYLEKRLWPNGARCPCCGLGERITTRKGGYYRCNQCKEDFTVRTGTIFERSHVPLHKWIYAMYLLVTSRKGISSMQLSKEIGITQKSAWFVLQRLREACGNDLTMLSGIVEVDETYIGGKEKGKHASKKLNAGRGAVGKTVVVGMRERGGRTIAMPVTGADAGTLHRAIHKNVEAGSTLHTDEHGGYAGIGGLFFKHSAINHTAGKYSSAGVTTNSIESVWAVMKRGLHGVYHHASPKHLGRYVNEFTFRLNDGAVRRHTLDRNGFTCQMCGLAPGDIDPATGRKVRLHLGHIKDKNLGGKDELSNLRALCSTCNQGAKNITGEKPTAICCPKCGVPDRMSSGHFSTGCGRSSAAAR